MKAVLFDQPGQPDVLYVGDIPDPIPAPDELLIRVHATALNRADLLQRGGAYPPPPGASPILGLEIAGEVEQAADGFQRGDRVMGVVTGGAYAERCTLPVGMAMRIPDRLTYTEAAAIPEAFLTAYLNLFTFGRLQAGESVLIHAGASGVGTAAIQLAKAIGARVFVTAGSDEKLALCHQLGADELINYKTESFRERIKSADHGRGVDVILDFIGEPYWNDNLACLARGGRLLLIGSMGGKTDGLAIAPIMFKNLTVTGTTLRATPLTEKTRLTAEFSAFALERITHGELRPVIDRVFPMAEVVNAHRYMHTNANMGKIILTIE